MKIKTVYYSSHFKKSLKKFKSKHPLIKRQIKSFLDNPFHPRFKTHQLSGKFKGYWSFSIDYRLRILFEFINQETIGFIDIDTHSIYR